MVRRAPAVAVLLLIGLGAAVVDCNLVVGAGAYSVGTACPAGDCTCGGYTYAASSCETCSKASCCSEGDECQADAPCGTLYDCLSACKPDDAACRRSCDTASPVENTGAAIALETCRAAHCKGECTSCGTFADWPAPGCAACVTSDCCTAANDCATDPTCAALQRCYRACTYPSCPGDCDAMLAGGPPMSNVVTTFANCLQGSCGSACAYGTHWDCAGAFQWPASAPGKDVSYTLHATSFADGSDVMGVLVRACNRNDIGCGSAFAMDKTDSKGLVTLPVPSGFDGYLFLTGANVMDSLVYLTWPVLTDPLTVVQLGSVMLYDLLVSEGGGNADPADGGLFVYTRDCLGQPAPGVALAVDQPLGNTEGFYFVGGSPVGGQTSTSTDAIGGFSNVSPGNTTLTATLAANQQKIAAFTVQMRANTLTFVTLTPTP